ncbi:MAG TPA: hypothetical protein VJB57_11925 [Dehalococcoidia bacterium]|nr:hypothetical protein [Dehalococcoidia bacterium]
MLVVEMSDGTRVEVPGARRVRRDEGKVRCIDALGRTLQVLEAKDVVSYAIAPDPSPEHLPMDETASG